jgi:predicted RNA-binding Zn-ribbon protein involved in translation (DUF1610 family)
MTYKFTLSNGRDVDIICPDCGNDEFRSQGPRKHLYHMFQCRKCDKCHSRFLDTGNIVTGGKPKWQYGPQIVELDGFETIRKIYDELTDKKFLETITPDEENILEQIDILEQIRNNLDGKDDIEYLCVQIAKYEEILDKIKSLRVKSESETMSDDCDTRSLFDF